MAKLTLYRRMLNKVLNSKGNPCGAYDKRSNPELLLVHWALPVPKHLDEEQLIKYRLLAEYYVTKRGCQLRQEAYKRPVPFKYNLASDIEQYAARAFLAHLEHVIGGGRL